MKNIYIKDKYNFVKVLNIFVVSVNTYSIKTISNSEICLVAKCVQLLINDKYLNTKIINLNINMHISNVIEILNSIIT